MHGNLNNLKTYCMLNQGFILYFPGFKKTITFINPFFNVGSMHGLLLKLWRDSESTWIIEFCIRLK